VLDEVRKQARRREIELVIVPTGQAVSILATFTKDTNAILHLTCWPAFGQPHNQPQAAARARFPPCNRSRRAQTAALVQPRPTYQPGYRQPQLISERHQAIAWEGAVVQ
jgi:hypothetical protein